MKIIFTRILRAALATVVFALFGGVFGIPNRGFAGPTRPSLRLPGHVPLESLAAARHIGRLPADRSVSLALVLPLRNQAELDNLLRSLYDPADPLYRSFLTSEEFSARFAPTREDYDALAGFARGLGLRVIGIHPNRTILDVAAPAGLVEVAFNLHLNLYEAMNGREFYAPDDNPQVPEFVSSRLLGVVGLDNAAIWHAHNHFMPAGSVPSWSPNQVGTGPGGGLTPSDIRTAYNLNGINATGAGQTLGLFELDGYTPSDVAKYESYYGLAAVPLQNVLVDGFSGRAGSGAGEVTLDIELQVALAPGASRIIVYEGPNTSAGVVDTYNRIATDNLAKQISTSWGLSELQSSTSVRNAENNAFMQMAAQGQSIYAASGDSGAYDNGSTLSVDDPASQPYMAGVGGTQLFVNSGETYNRETTWNVNNTVQGGAGGGGISAVWLIPDWQKGSISSNSQGSSTMRNVPDVSLNSDQYTGYSIYYKGGWYIFGGTSCASPLWAAFTALVNQQRASNGSSPLGFANPILYQLAQGGNYSSYFHDIADQSTNLWYIAVAGYDDATGLGSFNGANLWAALSSSGAPIAPPPAPTNLTATPGDTTVSLSWTGSSGATSYSVYRGVASNSEGSTPIATGITTTSYKDTGLTDGTTYYYKVTATNSAGNSGVSNEASATPIATVLSITSGPTATPSRTSASIQWTTNVASTSVVRYGTRSGNLSQTSSNSALVTSHSLTLNGLSRRQIYYYQVLSTAGSTMISSSVGSFTTQ
jgi:subtilase family serine protease